MNGTLSHSVLRNTSFWNGSKVPMRFRRGSRQEVSGLARSWALLFPLSCSSLGVASKSSQAFVLETRRKCWFSSKTDEAFTPLALLTQKQVAIYTHLQPLSGALLVHCEGLNRLWGFRQDPWCLRMWAESRGDRAFVIANLCSRGLDTNSEHEGLCPFCTHSSH